MNTVLVSSHYTSIEIKLALLEHRINNLTDMGLSEHAWITPEHKTPHPMLQFFSSLFLKLPIIDKVLSMISLGLTGFLANRSSFTQSEIVSYSSGLSTAPSPLKFKGSV